MRELGSQEYQAKLLEAQARVRLVVSCTNQSLSGSVLLAGMRGPLGRPATLCFANGCRTICLCFADLHVSFHAMRLRNICSTDGVSNSAKRSLTCATGNALRHARWGCRGS